MIDFSPIEMTKKQLDFMQSEWYRKDKMITFIKKQGLPIASKGEVNNIDKIMILREAGLLK